MVHNWKDLPYRIACSTRAMRILRAIGLPPGHVQDTIVVAGSPRSGTTWLAELLATLPEYSLVDEPLHQRWPDVKRAGFNEWRPYIAPAASVPAANAYMENALTGRVASNRQFSASGHGAKLKELLWGQKNVVKFVRANRLLHWVHNQFPVRGMVLMLRHPCAVIASQLDHKNNRWNHIQPPRRDDLQTGFCGWIPGDVFQRFKSVLASVRSPAGRLAAVWCLDTYFPLYEEDSFPGLITTYESLLARGADEVKRIFEALDASVPEQALRSFDEASYSASADLMTKDVHRQLSKWRDKLSRDQIEEVLRIVEGFGLDFYTDALEPEYARINTLTESDVVDLHGKAEAV